MTENLETILPGDAETKERRAFTASEMVGCTVCSRSNPPNRANCLYCGAALETTPANLAQASTARADAKADDVFHVVLVPAQAREISESARAEVAALFHLTPSELTSALDSRTAPLCSRQTPADAEKICEGLRALGIETVTVSDHALKLESASQDLRTMEFQEQSLIGVARHGVGKLSASWEDIVLFVPGRLQTTTIEVEQKRNQGRVLDERALSVDEAVLDIYPRNAETGWRIRSGSFNFSCLGKEKAFTTFENFNSLIRLLRRRAGSAVFDDSYIRLRSVLGKVWPVDEAGKTERLRYVVRKFEAKITSSDNEAQFTRYSRLLHFLITRESEGNDET